MDPLSVPGTSVSQSLAEVMERLGTATEPVVVIAQELIVAPRALAPITGDPFAATSLLVRPASKDADVRVRHHVVTSIGTAFHDVTAPDSRSVGALIIATPDAAAAIDAIEDLLAAVESGEVHSDGGDVIELIALALVRSGTSVKAVEMVDVPWTRSTDDVDAARRDATSVSDERIAQLQANRADDGFYSTFVVRKASKPLTRIALRLGLTPNSVTLMSFAIGIAAAAAFAVGDRWALVLGAVLLQLSLVVDCVDGEVARATRQFSALGAWLDASTDRVKEFLAYAGLAYGAARSGVDIWWIAVVLVVLQTTRHMTDYDFSRVQRLREARVDPRDIRVSDDGAAGSTAGWSVSGAMELSTRMNRRDAVRWFKRAIHMPIGERWLVISVFAALLGPTWALGALLVLGLLALAYVMTGRVLRTFTWQGPTPDAGVLLLRRQGDFGPLASLIAVAVPERTRSRLWSSRSGWAIPALLRLIELGVVAVVALAWFPAPTVVAFWWMAVVAFHHYDTLYRALQGSPSPRWITWLGLGWDGRSVLVIVLAAVGLNAVTTGLTVGVWVMVVLFVVVSSVQWLSVQGSRAS